MYLCRKITKNITTMSKKKGGKRVNKKQLIEMLQTFFQEHPNEVFSFKQIFRALKLDTHPAKMLAIETMDEMAWRERSSVRLMEKIRSSPTMAENPSLSPSATLCLPLMAIVSVWR